MFRFISSPVRYIFFFIAALAILFPPDTNAGSNFCKTLPAPDASESVVTVNSIQALQNEINNAYGQKTIYLESGIYNVTTSSWITVTKPDITIRSLSGNRDDVIIKGPGMNAPVGYGIQVFDSRITIADLTIRDVGNHAIQVAKTSGKSTDDLLFHNVRGIDAGQQLFKTSGGIMHNGVIECSQFEYTTTLHQGCYTNGIDIIGTQNWIIRDNVVKNIKGASCLAGPAILIWPADKDVVCSNTIVERNILIDNDSGIFLGNSYAQGVNHTGGIIRNNFIKGHSGSDAAIGLVRAEGATVINNTIYSPNGTVPWAIEVRYAESTNCTIMNNLTDKYIFDDRDGASAALVSNKTNATASMFLNIDAGDLHLVSDSFSGISNAGTFSELRVEDIDGESVYGGSPDIGADEYQQTDGSILIEAPTNLRAIDY